MSYVPSLYPEPFIDYACCITCEATLATPEAATQHTRDTMRPVSDEPRVTARSHRVRVLNPTRAERIRRHIETLIEDANEQYGEVDWLSREVDVDDGVYEDVAEQLRDLAESGQVGWGEVRPALTFHPAYRNAWDEVLRETESAPDPVHPDQLDLLADLEARA